MDRAQIFVVAEKIQKEEEHTFEGVKMNGAGCIVEGLEVEKNDAADCMASLSMPEPQPISMNPFEGENQNFGKEAPFITEEPLKTAHGWANAPADAKEFSLMLCEGKVRRVGLLKKDETGAYNTVEIYTSKKVEQPLIRIKNGEYVVYMEDELLDKNGEKQAITRGVILIDCAPNGSGLHYGWETP